MLTKLFLASFGLLILSMYFYVVHDDISARQLKSMMELKYQYSEDLEQAKEQHPVGDYAPLVNYLPDNAHDIHTRTTGGYLQLIADYKFAGSYNTKFLNKLYTEILDKNKQSQLLDKMLTCKWQNPPVAPFQYYVIKEKDFRKSSVYLLLNHQTHQAWHLYLAPVDIINPDLKLACDIE